MTTSDAGEESAAGYTPTFPVVGLGASAGGLEALQELFDNMPADPGMAFVVITHHPPDQPSLLAELLARHTVMPVTQVVEATPLEPNRVYTIRPGRNAALVDGVLQPMEPPAGGRPLPPIDYFFRALARDQRDRAIGVVLSGTGSDGALGLKEIKGTLGMAMVQDERSARYSGMPHAAVATGLAVQVLPAGEMPGQLLAYAETLAVGRSGALDLGESPSESLRPILVVLRDRAGHDFSRYKARTVARRVERRMSVHRMKSVPRYVRYLQDNPGEVDLLFRELLIGVTSFFRDGPAWDALGESLRELLKDKPDGYVVRAWVSGCSTGEEAYSLAMLLREQMDGLDRSLSAQIFATDLDARAVEVARAAAYPDGIANDVNAQRLQRFFTHGQDAYRVKKEIRDMCVFAVQSLIADPPFTKLDVLSCRNLLIYLDASLQKRLLPLFHYALKPNGLLFLGSSESIGDGREPFDAVDKKWRVFRRSEVVHPGYGAGFPVAGAALEPQPRAPRRAPPVGAVNLQSVIERLLLKQLVPPTVIVRERGDVVHVHGRTGQFLEPAQGAQATANVFNMAREGLQVGLSAAVRQAIATGDEVVKRGVPVKSNGGTSAVDVHAVQLQHPEQLRGLVRISFENVQALAQPLPAETLDDEAAASDQLSELERELQHLRENHQGTLEELETANEELQLTNEEMQSANEELQSANEELETSKEEMQSLNEELRTVNDELQGTVDELSTTSDDMKNLLNGTDIATVFLDGDLRIKRFTEQARIVIRLIPTDVGRPIGDLVSTLRYDELADDAAEVLRTLVPKQLEVQADDDKTYLMRVLPYRTTDNVIDGLVLTFVDITKVKSLERAQQRLVAALERAPASVFGQDKDLRFTWAYGGIFGRGEDELVGRTDREVFGAEADVLGDVKRRVLESGDAHRQRATVTIDGARRTFDFYIEPTRDEDGDTTGLSCVAMELAADNDGDAGEGA